MRQRHWTHDQTLQELERTAREMDARGYTLSRRQLHRWLSGEVTAPRGVACQVAERLFGHPIERLLMPADQPTDQPVAADEGYGHVEVAQHITDAAGTSRDHAARAATGYADPATLEQLRVEVQRLAHAYASTPPLLLHAALVRTRDLAYEVVARTRRPRQLADAYLVAGQACGLLASTAYDLGYADAADNEARAAYTYGQIIGHDRLRAWARSVQATVAFWSGRPREGLRYAGTALEYAEGTQAARLHAIAARAWSMLGAEYEAEQDLRHAFAEVDADDPADDLTEVGGEFTFGPARLALCAGAVHVRLGRGREAARYARDALRLYEAAPPDQQRWGVQYGAWIDLATARALGGELDGAEAAVQPALSLDPARRTARLTRRLLGLRALMGSADYRDASPARRITQAVDDFAAGSLSSPPSLPPGS